MDAALGALFGELLKAVIEAVKETANFKSMLSRLKDTLSEVKPIVDEIEKLNVTLGRPIAETKKLADLFRDGKVLVDKCLTIGKLDLKERYCHSKKLRKHYASLLEFFEINFTAISAMDVKKILVAVDELRLRNYNNGGGGSSGFRGSCGVPEPPELIVGLDMQLEELKAKIMLNDEMRLVGISAPPGCGKTTLARMLCNDEDIKGIFEDNIFYVTVSKPANFQVIVQKLFLHKDRQQPLFQSDEDALVQLENFLLQQGPDPILLVFDDVWPEWESHILDLRFRRILGYKVLVTSRSTFPNFDSTHDLKFLKHLDAKTLFCHFAFRDGIPNVSDDLVQKMVKRCKRFPLALKVVGRSLHGQLEAAWETRLADWSEGESILDPYEQLLRCLRTSVDALDSMPKLKQLFLDLGSFPEDQEIPASALMDICAELYYLDENGMRTLDNLKKLAFRNLLNIVSRRKDGIEVDCFCNDYFVTQHDMLRELAIYLSDKEPIERRKRLILNLPNSNFDESQLPIHARLLSISTGETVSSIPCNIELTEVEVVILNLQAETYNLPQFMKKMQRLKVLIVTNNGYCPAKLGYLSILNSLSSLRRIRLEHVSISSLGTSSLPMANLLIISLVMYEIGDTFDKCTTEIPLMFPNLVEIEIEYCDDLVHFPAGLCNILTLKKLSITNCNNLHSLPEEFGRLTNLEILRLHSCIKLEELPESTGSLHKLKIIDISDCVGLSKMPDRTRELSSLKKLHMRGCLGIHELPQSVEDLTGLELVICDEQIYYRWKSHEELAHVKIDKRKAHVNLNWLHNLGD